MKKKRKKAFFPTMGYHTDLSGDFIIDKIPDKTIRNMITVLNNNYPNEGKEYEEYEEEEEDKEEKEWIRAKIDKISKNYPKQSTCPWTLGICKRDLSDDWKDIGNGIKEKIPHPPEEVAILSAEGMEKPYDYIEWIVFLVKELLQPKGYIVNGTVAWSGEEKGDYGEIVIVNNKIYIKEPPLIQLVITHVYE